MSVTGDMVDEAGEFGAEMERVAIVRWLRTTFAQNRNAQEIADAIERGEHEHRSTGAENGE